MSVNQQFITIPKVLAKVPNLLRHLPETLKGLKYSKLTDTTLPVGLGLKFDEAAKAQPDVYAVINDDRYYTYKEFNEWSNRISNYFLEQGYKKGDRVAVFIENRAELLAVILGLAKIGVISALINTSQKGKVLIHSMNLAEAKTAIIGDELVDEFSEVRDEINLKHVPYWVADQDTIKHAGDAPKSFENLARVIVEHSTETPSITNQIYINDSAFYIYTSGTTGLPKAVNFNHGRFMKGLGGFGHASLHLRPHDRMFVTLPFYHSTALIVCWGSVLAGHAGIIVSRKFSASRFWDDAIKYNATAFGYVGELCRYLIAQPEREVDKQHSIRKMVGNGLRPAIWDQFKERFLIQGVFEFYASSEGNVGFTNLFNFDKTVGFSPMTYSIVKYDRDTDQPVRDSNGFLVKLDRGEDGLLIGEISDKSPFHGYTDPEKTKKVILTDVFKKGDRWFNTGDIMRDIGLKHTQFVDRTGDTFRWKSENVSTTEVENAVNEYPQIEESVVYGVEVPNTIGRAGMAQLNLKCGIEKFDFVEFASILRKCLPSYAIPLFLRIDNKLQQTATFKYQKSRLKDEAYDLTKQSNPIYVLLPKEEGYIALTPEIQNDIDNGKYKF